MKKSITYKNEVYTLADLPMWVQRARNRQARLNEISADELTPNIIILNEQILLVEALLICEMIINELTEYDRSSEVSIMTFLLDNLKAERSGVCSVWAK